MKTDKKELSFSAVSDKSVVQKTEYFDTSSCFIKGSFLKKNVKEKKWRLLLRVIVFLAIVVVLLLYFSSVMNTKWTKYENYYHLEEGSVDYITLGASHCLSSLNPLYIYAKTGIRGYNLADEAQSIAFSYYWLREALRSQVPKLVFYDVGNLLYDGSYMAEAWKLKEYAAMRMSENKVSCVLNTAGSLESGIGGFLPFFYFHDRWKGLTEQDFSPDYGVNAANGANIVFAVNGNSEPPAVNLFEKDLFGDAEKRYESMILEESRAYFQKMFDLCQSHGIQLIPVKFPTNSWDEKRSGMVEQFLSGYDLHLLDLNRVLSLINWETDSYDGGYHTNYWGNCKTSDYLGDYMKEHFELSDGRSDKRWQDLLAAFCKKEEDSLIGPGDQREHYWNWLQMAKEDNLVILAVNGNLSGSTGKINKRLRLLGFSGYSEKHRNQSYIAVMDKGDILFEKWDDRIMQYECILENGASLEVFSSGNKSHIGVVPGQAQISIDRQEAAEGSQGLNIVVYNPDSGRILSSMTQYNGAAWNLKRSFSAEEGEEDEGEYKGNEYDLYAGRTDWKICPAEERNETGDVSDHFAGQDVILQFTGAGSYLVCNPDGRYLTVTSAGNQADSPVVWQDYSGLATQKWELRNQNDGDDACLLVSLYNHLYLGGSAVQLFAVEKGGEKPVLVLK